MKEIPVYSRGVLVACARVDDEVHDRLAKHRWHRHHTGYAYSGRWLREEKKSTQVLMHREVLGLTPGDGKIADHINRDRLDNRRKNLRVVSASDNARNCAPRGGTSRYRNVTWHKGLERWQASVKFQYRSYYLGCFETEEEAAEVAAAWRQEHCPNGPQGLVA